MRSKVMLKKNDCNFCCLVLFFTVYFTFVFVFFFSVHQSLIRICSKAVILQKVNSKSNVLNISPLCLKVRNVSGLCSL